MEVQCLHSGNDLCILGSDVFLEMVLTEQGSLVLGIVVQSEKLNEIIQLQEFMFIHDLYIYMNA